MTTCPKCNGSRIIGPAFEETGHGERLRYRCLRCGYETTTPTRDAKPNPLDELRRAQGIRRSPMTPWMVDHWGRE